MSYFAVVLLALAVSIDGLGVGLACGLGKLRLPPLSLVLMGLASGGAVLLSMTAGSIVATFINPSITAWIGGVLLIGFGLWMLKDQFSSGEKQGFLSMLDDPVQADADLSGEINGKEAMVLGVALAFDAFGAGFGAAMAGFAPLATAIAVAISKVLLVGTGNYLGSLFADLKWVDALKFLPGVIICSLGLLQIFVF